MLYGILCSGLTQKTSLSFISSNSSFSECVRHYQLSFPTFDLNELSETDELQWWKDQLFDNNDAKPILSSTVGKHSFTSCTFTSLTSESSRGALAFTTGGENSVSDCKFSGCSSSTSIYNYNGGGAIFSNSCSRLSVSSYAFNLCTSTSLAGGIFATEGCNSVLLSCCLFILWYCLHSGGGMSTHLGPTSAVSSSRFICCTANWAGGGIYHNSNSEHSHFTLSNSLFKDNTARSSDNNTPGGGGFGDFRSNTYISKYFFSFFTVNTDSANLAHDIHVRDSTISFSDILHCFTTTSVKAFRNKESYANAWLPLGTLL